MKYATASEYQPNSVWNVPKNLIKKSEDAVNLSPSSN